MATPCTANIANYPSFFFLFAITTYTVHLKQPNKRYCTEYRISIPNGCPLHKISSKKGGCLILTENVCFTIYFRGSVNALKNCKMGLRTFHQWQVNSQRQWNVVNGGTYDKFASIDNTTSDPVWIDLALIRLFSKEARAFLSKIQLYIWIMYSRQLLLLIYILIANSWVHPMLYCVK